MFALPALLWAGWEAVAPGLLSQECGTLSQGDCRLPVQSPVFTASVNSELLELSGFFAGWEGL